MAYSHKYMSNTNKVYKTKNGIVIKHFNNINLNDFHFKYVDGNTEEFIKKHAEIFNNICDSHKVLALEQETIDRLATMINICRNKLSKEDADIMIAELNGLRSSFAKKLEVLFEYINKLENL